MDLDSKVVRVDGREILLTRTEFGLLSTLARRPGRCSTVTVS